MSYDTLLPGNNPADAATRDLHVLVQGARGNGRGLVRSDTWAVGDTAEVESEDAPTVGGLSLYVQGVLAVTGCSVSWIPPTAVVVQSLSVWGQ